MRRLTTSVTATVLVCASAAAACGQPKEQPAVKWHSDITQAQVLTKQQNRPMLLFITVDSCYYCTKMKHFTYSDQQVISEISTKFIPAKIDAAEQVSLVRHLGVRLFPTTVIISPENKVLDRISGYVDSHSLRQRMAAATANRRTASRTIGTATEHR